MEFVDVAIARTPSNGKLEDLEDYYQVRFLFI